MAYAVLEMAKVNLSNLVPLPLCFGFLDLNFDLGFLTTRGLLLPSRGGIFWSKISWINQLKKGGVLPLGWLETWELLGELL